MIRRFLDSNFWKSEGWFDGTLVRIDPYSEHRSFYWVELDTPVQSAQGGLTGLVSVSSACGGVFGSFGTRPTTV